VLWAATHLIIAGTLSGTIFTGAFLIDAVAGTSSLDANYARRARGPWAAVARVASILTFAAIVQGRNHFAFAEIRLWRIAVAVVLWFVLHPLVYGMNPWRYIS
jgi:uncharacterized membrane protein